jgi:hypothetical protein
MNFLDLFQNPDGSYSSRRCFGIILVLAGLVGWYLKLDGTVATFVVGFGGVLLGVTSFDKRGPL